MIKVYALREPLKIARIKAGLYQSEVAESANVTQNTYAQIESGRKSTSGKTAKLICRRLHVKLDDVFRVEEVKRWELQ